MPYTEYKYISRNTNKVTTDSTHTLKGKSK